MKAVFYSEKTKKYYDSEEACTAAEVEFDKAYAEEARKKEVRKGRADEVEAARQSMLEARKKANDAIAAARKVYDDAVNAAEQEVAEAHENYSKLLNQFNKDYGSYHMSIDGDEFYKLINYFFNF